MYTFKPIKFNLPIDILMRISLLFIFLFSVTLTFANKSASEIYVDLQKLHSLKRVLYIAAHPDDENTRALAYFSLGEKAETAYLSLTRGDGGQNLIGDELSEDLGVLRTQELLAARSFDGAKQFFTRAVDFGYSKSAEESFEKWGKAEMLSDVVLVIRQFKPDVIITRFPPDKRGGHGHHTASAILAMEAFEKAADPNYLPEQVNDHGVWQAAAVYWNSSVWWNKKLGEEAENNPDFLVADIGGYNPILGMSYNEIGTLARSEHKCQGFGAVIERGSRIEYFKHLVGQKLKTSFFEENKQSWTQLVDDKYNQNFEHLLADFDFVNLDKNVPALLAIKKGLERLPESTIKSEKLERCKKIIVDCLGLHIEIVGTDYGFAKGTETQLSLNLINRSSTPIKLMAVNNGMNAIQVIDKTLVQNEVLSQEITEQISHSISNPYWLNAPFVNIFNVLEKQLLGKADAGAAVSKLITLKINEELIVLKIPVIYKWRDPSYGERQRNLISTPEFTVNFEQNLAILKPGETKIIRMKIHSFKKNLKDEIKISGPKGWGISPNIIPINIEKKHGVAWVEFELKSTDESVRGPLRLTNSTGALLLSFTEIAYDHIPTQTIFKLAVPECIKLDAKIKAGRIAYIKGVDDAVPQAIEQLGFEVSVHEVNELSILDLKQFQSVVLGIRIYNVYPELENFEDKLFTYVKAGGNVIMQYNTASRRASGQTFGPEPFELSRNRVTEEDAKVTFLNAEHKLLNSPNKISTSDFDHWVQERGLYFAANWSDDYTPLLSWHDEGESAQNGALIVAKYGEGQFIYTGISFFRELPNGVEGAYRLFANLLSY